MQKFLKISFGLLLALSAVFADRLSCAEVAPIGYWPLNEGEGTAAKNKISAETDGVIRNAEWIAGDVTMYGQQEKFLYFNGQSSLVEIPAGKFKFSGKLTIEATVKLEKKPGEDLSKWKELNHCIVYNTYKESGFELAINSWGKISAYVNTSAGLKAVREFGAPLFGEWHKIALTYDGSNIIIYVDGHPRATEAHSGTVKMGELLRIGSRGDNSFAKGCIKDVKIYNDVAIGKTEHSFVPVVIYESSFDGRIEACYKNLRDATRHVFASRGTPELNGRLDDGCWQNSQKLTDFLLAGNKPPAFAREKTAGYVCFDDANLYIGMECSESSMDKICRNVLEHDSTVWVDDCVEIFLADKGVPKKYYHLFVTPAGTQADVEVEFIEKTASGIRYRNNFGWNPAWTVAVSRNDKSWTAEISMPWKELGINADNLLINLCRAEKPSGEFSSFGYLDTSAFNDPDGFNPVSTRSRDVPAEERFISLVNQVRELEENKRIQLSRVKSSYNFPYAFDFGTASSPAREGFVRITEKSLYQKGSAAGFKRNEGITAATRENTYWGKQGYLGDLTCDFVEGKDDNEFIVDVPDGEYLVYFLIGDVNVPPPFSVNIGGKEVFKSSMSSNIYRLQSVHATAEKGSLTIGFRGEHGWLLNALVLYPWADAFRFAKDIERLDDEICLGSNPEFIAKYIQYRFEDKTPLPPADSKAEKSGYFLYPHSYLDIIYQGSTPKAERINDPVEAAAAPGEYIPVAFSLYPIRNLEDVNIEYTDFISKDKKTIDKSLIQLREVKHYYHNVAGFRPVRYMRFPKLLESFSPHYFLQGRNYTFWFTVKVPENAKSGDYFSTVSVKTSEGNTESFMVKLTVYPFTLDPIEDYSFGMCYLMPKQNLQRGIDGWDTMSLELKDMKEHNMNTVAPMFIIQNIWPEFGTPGKSFNGEALVKFFRHIKQSGLTRPVPIAPAPFFPHELHGGQNAKTVDFKPEEWTYVKDALKQLQYKSKQEGLPDFYFYMDEPYMVVVRDNYRPVFEYMRNNGMKTFCTVAAGPHYYPLFPVLDVCCYGYGIGAKREILKDVLLQAEKWKHEFWVYNGPTWSYIPAKSRFNIGYGTWQTGAKGHIIWTYYVAWVGGQPLNPLSNTSGVHAHEILPDLNGPIPTTTWEAIREGIDDFKYIRTLEKLIERSNGSSRAAEAKKFLDNLKDEIEEVSLKGVWNDPGTGEPLEGNPLWSHRKYDDARKTIAGYIMELKP